MEKVRPWCGQLSDRGRLRNRTECILLHKPIYGFVKYKQKSYWNTTSGFDFYVITYRWPSRLELRCVRTSTKSFSNFHLIWCVGRPRPHMRTSVTSTRSKVKVTELPKLQKVHFSRSTSSAILAWSSKLMIGGHSMGPGLQLVGARFMNFHLGKLSREF